MSYTREFKIRQPNGYWKNTLEDFLRSNEEYIKITWDPTSYNKSPKSLQSVVSGIISREKMPLRTALRGTNLYIVKHKRV